MFIKSAIALCVGIAGIAGCSGHDRVAKPLVVTIDEGNTDVIDVSPPQRLDVIMDGFEGAPERCANMGGELIVDLRKKEMNSNGEDVEFFATCEGVDY